VPLSDLLLSKKLLQLDKVLELFNQLFVASFFVGRSIKGFTRSTHFSTEIVTIHLLKRAGNVNFVLTRKAILSSKNTLSNSKSSGKGEPLTEKLPKRGLVQNFLREAQIPPVLFQRKKDSFCPWASTALGFETS